MQFSQESQSHKAPAAPFAEQGKKDTGLHSFLIIAHLHGVPADPEQIRHNFAIGPEGMSTTDLLRVAKELNFKAKAITADFSRVPKLPLPAIAETANGYMVVAKCEGEKLLVLEPGGKPKALGKDEFLGIWTGKLILFSHRGAGILNQQGYFGLKWFIPVVWKYRAALRDVLIASFLIQLFALTTPLFTQVIIDKVLVHNGITTLNVLAFGLVAIMVFEAALNILKTYVFTHTTSQIDVILGARLFKHLVSLPLIYFESRRVGDTVARVREIENIRNFLTGPPLNSALDLLFIAVFLIVMFLYSPTLTFVVLGSIPLFAALSFVATPLLRSRLEERFNRGADAQSYLVEAVNGIQTVKSFALEPEAQKKWEGLLAEYTKSGFRTYKVSGVAGALGQFIYRSANIIILWIGAHLVIKNEITVGQLIAFQMLSSRVIDPVLRLVQSWQDFQQVGISLRRLGDIFNSRPEQIMSSARTRLPAIKGNIRFENVRFRYRVDGPEVLHDVSFNIEPGAIIGVVGRSGSGKSTIAKLVQRLYCPESGKIMIDGVDISLADPAWLRRQIGVVLQEGFLFNASVRENIAINRPSMPLSEVIKAATLAGAHEFITELQDGYDTVVGERGVALSGGQKQRIAIARALIMNPRILIFDEATSALDYESESIIQKNLKKICEGRTVIIIAHRLSTLRMADRIYVIDRGKIVEHGAPSDLAVRGGLYAHLLRQQEMVF